MSDSRRDFIKLLAIGAGGVTSGAFFAPAAALAAGGKTYYVSQSVGDDEAAGEKPDAPWKTLARASRQKLEPGDSVLLKAGDKWNEELRPRGSGTPQKPILISRYGDGPRPIIDREDDKRDLSGIFLEDQAGFKIVGLEFARCMTGIYAEYYADLPTREYFWIEDCYFHDALHYQPYQDYPKRKIGLGVCFFSHERKNRIVLSDITIKNCTFRRLASGVWTNSPDNFNKNASNIYNFGKMTFENCLFEEGYQWQMGIRGVAGGLVRNCITHDIGRGFRSFNGVAGGMFFRCKDWLFEDSEWGFIDIGLGSGDGEAFDFEGNCDNMTMRNCLFHDTDGPGFLLCCYASDPHPNLGIRMENCVLNGKSKRPIGLPRCEIVNTTDWNEAVWDNCRFYLAKGEVLMRVMDPEKDKRSSWVKCSLKHLADACSSTPLVSSATASSQATGYGAPQAVDGNADTAWKPADNSPSWLELRFARPAHVNEFKISEAAGSKVVRYAIECYDEKLKQWVSCFNGRGIGQDFVAPIVARTTSRARLRIDQTEDGQAPAITAFLAYDDPTGAPLNSPRGVWPPDTVGR